MAGNLAGGTFAGVEAGRGKPRPYKVTLARSRTLLRRAQERPLPFDTKGKQKAAAPD